MLPFFLYRIYLLKNNSMFFNISFTEFKKMMQEGIDKLLYSNENPEMQDLVVIENNKNQNEHTDDKAQENSSRNQ